MLDDYENIASHYSPYTRRLRRCIRHMSIYNAAWCVVLDSQRRWADGEDTVEMRCGYRAGVPLQQPYTKYEPDSDEVRVTYKRVSEDAGSCSPLRRGSSPAASSMSTAWLPRPSSGCRGVTLRTLIVVVLFMSGLIVGYLIRRAVTSSAHPHCTSGRPLTSSASYQVTELTLWRPLLPYGYRYKASCARPG